MKTIHDDVRLLLQLLIGNVNHCTLSNHSDFSHYGITLEKKISFDTV